MKNRVCEDGALVSPWPRRPASAGHRQLRDAEDNPDQVLEWNQIFIDTLIVTNTANSSSQRLGAIVHTAIFDAYNGIERRYSRSSSDGRPSWRLASGGGHRRRAHRARRAVPVAKTGSSTTATTASLAALSDDGEDGGESRARGIAWGNEVAQAVLAWRASDGFNGIYAPFNGGTAIGQWRPTPRLVPPRPPAAP